MDSDDAETIKDALRTISDVSKAVITQDRKNNFNLTLYIEQLVNTQDEELNIPWWIINSYSRVCNCRFSELEEREKPLILAIELAKLTTFEVEIPSAEVILQKAGLNDSDKFTFSNFIEGVENLNEVFPIDENEININTPVLYTLKNKFEGKGGEENINAKLAINNEKELSNLEWAMQIYRELLAIYSRSEYS